MEERVKQLEQQVKDLQTRLNQGEYISLKVMKKDLQVQRLGVNGKQPPAQTTIADPTGGVTIDAQARTAINSIIDVLQQIGFLR